jgi:HSP20 family protein
MSYKAIVPWAERFSADFMSNFLRDFDRAWEPVLGRNAVKGEGFIPSLGFHERDNEYVVTAEVPGMEEKDVQVEFRDGSLIVTGKKEEKVEKSEKGRTYSEHRYGEFRREISLPSDVDEEKIDAELKSGVLTLRIPRVIESKSAKKLKIRQTN